MLNRGKKDTQDVVFFLRDQMGAWWELGGKKEISSP